MDRSWIKKARNSIEYRQGVEEFLEFAFRNSSYDGKIMCPCVKCVNRSLQTYDDARVHLICDGFLKGYTCWVSHGEEPSIDVIASTSSLSNSHAQRTTPSEQCNFAHMNQWRADDIVGLLNDAFGIHNQENERLGGQQAERAGFNGDEPFDGGNDSHQEFDIEHDIERPNHGTSKFNELLKEFKDELYPGCPMSSKLSCILRLYHLKCLNGWSTKSFSMLLECLVDMLPQGATLPRSHYEVKKIINDLGLHYEKIHACENDCMLFRGDRANLDACTICGSSRWVLQKGKDLNCGNGSTGSSTSKKKRPVKVLRYFPLIPRLQRLYISTKTSSDMRWHEEEHKKDGFLRHAADGEAWKAFDVRYPDFSLDSRNVRLALCSDGFNPYRTMNTTYSTWPVVLSIYNFPPWICMKQTSLILSMIIPGEKSPGNNIDTYLEPLIEELLHLWEGVGTYDASTQQTFNMRAALMCTINDFPAYGNLSGWSTHGKFACPICVESTDGKWLYKGGKHCYMNHRRWLPEDHRFRHQKYCFDGKEELRTAPKRASGSEVLRQLDGIQFTLGKAIKSRVRNAKRKRSTTNSDLNISTNVSRKSSDPKNWWKKRSIFFKLPYWEHNLLRHNLDVMHIEKNVCDNLIRTLLNLDSKSKDNLKARLDLVDLGIRPDLHPQVLVNGRRRLPPACFTMTKKEKATFCQIVKDVKMPDGYASNISRCVNVKECKIVGLKSHDSHIIMETLLPVALRACSPSKQVTTVVIELATFFKALCSKVLDPNELDKLQNRIVINLCQMERIFLPSFFTIMVHLIVHLVEEAKLGGPVHYRWMYPFERYFVRLKSYVRNKAQPEGSIAEGYIAEECLTFCSRYLENVETRYNRPLRNLDPPPDMGHSQYMFSSAGNPIGKVENIVLENKVLTQAHRYVLRHCDQVESFRQQFIDIEKRKRRRNGHLNENEKAKLLNEKFGDWFQQRVIKMGDDNVSREIVILATGPNKVAKRFSGFIRNGIRFHTKAREENMATQNSGVVNVSEADGINYYGKLMDIIELNYSDCLKVVLFKCDWVNVHHSMGIKQHEFGFTLVNFSRLIHTGEKIEDDPFVFSSQVEQVFYVQDPNCENLSVVVRFRPRDAFDLGREDDNVDEVEHSTTLNDQSFNEDHLNWVRNDVDEDEIV